MGVVVLMKSPRSSTRGRAPNKADSNWSRLQQLSPRVAQVNIPREKRLLIARFDVVEMVVLWGDGRDGRESRLMTRGEGSHPFETSKLMAGSGSTALCYLTHGIPKCDKLESEKKASDPRTRRRSPKTTQLYSNISLPKVKQKTRGDIPLTPIHNPNPNPTIILVLTLTFAAASLRVGLR